MALGGCFALAMMKRLPEGEVRDGLLEEISCLDVIAEVMRRALDSIQI